MKIIDVSGYSGIICPITKRRFEFLFEDLPNFSGSIVKGVLNDEVPEVSCIDDGDEEFSSSWESYYENLESDPVDDDGEELDTAGRLEFYVKKFPDRYQALKYTQEGMGCGPISITCYYIVDANINPGDILFEESE